MRNWNPHRSIFQTPQSQTLSQLQPTASQLNVPISTSSSSFPPPSPFTASTSPYPLYSSTIQQQQQPNEYHQQHPQQQQYIYQPPPFAPLHQLKGETNLKSDFVKYLSEINQFRDIYDKNGIADSTLCSNDDNNIGSSIATAATAITTPTNTTYQSRDLKGNDYKGKSHTNFPNEKYSDVLLHPLDDQASTRNSTMTMLSTYLPSTSYHQDIDEYKKYLRHPYQQQQLPVQQQQPPLYAPTYPPERSIPSIEINRIPSMMTTPAINSRFQSIDDIKTHQLTNNDKPEKSNLFNELEPEYQQQPPTSLQSSIHLNDPLPVVVVATSNDDNNLLLNNSSNSLQMPNINNTAVSISNTSANVSAINTNGDITAINHAEDETIHSMPPTNLNDDDANYISHQTTNAKLENATVSKLPTPPKSYHPSPTNTTTPNESPDTVPQQIYDTNIIENTKNQLSPTDHRIGMKLNSTEISQRTTVENQVASDSGNTDELPNIDKIEEEFYGERIDPNQTQVPSSAPNTENVLSEELNSLAQNEAESVAVAYDEYNSTEPAYNSEQQEYYQEQQPVYDEQGNQGDAIYTENAGEYPDQSYYNEDGTYASVDPNAAVQQYDETQYQVNNT